MSHTPDIVKLAIRGNPLDTLTAEDIPGNGGGQLGYIQGNDEALCEYLDTLHAGIAGPYRVTLTNSTAPRKRGRPAKGDGEARPFSFLLRGAAGTQPAPVVNGQPAAAPVVPLQLAGESAENRVRAELLKEKADALEKELDELYAELDEAGEDLEAAEEQLSAAPAPAPVPLKWYETEAFGQWVMKVGEPLGHALAKKLLGGGGIVAPAAAQPVSAAAADAVARAGDELTEAERRLIVANRNARKMHGDAAVDAELAPLVNTYADIDPATISPQGGQA